MATKSKNWISHWLVKVTTLIVVLSTFLWFTNDTYDKLSAGELDLIFTDFRQSDQYYAFVDNYYTQVFDAYIDTFADLAPQRVTQLNQVKDKYYLVVTQDSKIYSNLPEVQTYLKNVQTKHDNQGIFSMGDVNKVMDLFYQSPAIEDIFAITGESEPRFGSKGIYFSKRTHGWEQIYMGFSKDAIEKETLVFDLEKGSTHKTFFAQALLTLGVVLGGMILLAFVSGRRPHSDALHLNYLDWLYLDCLLLLWFLIESALIGMGSEILYATGQYAIKPVLLCAAAISALLGLWVWTSFWKRIKDKSLFRHTFVAWCWRNTLGLAFLWLKKGFHTLKTGPVYGYSLLVMGSFAAANLFSLLLLAFFVNVFSEVGFIIGMVLYLIPIAALLVYLVHNDQQIDLAVKGLARIQGGDLSHKLALKGSHMFKTLSEGINNLSDALDNAVKKALQSERMKTELITNVSHDLKTPLTSIINYVDLLKREGLDSPQAAHYLSILDQKSEQLKKLTLDLFDAAKAASGSITVELAPLHSLDFVNQLIGEYEDRLSEANLQLVTKLEPTPDFLCADGRHLWRVFDNLLGNIVKYAAPHSRVYLELYPENDGVAICLKNMSNSPLNMPAEMLLERFKRGDESRSTEGSGLGLSIALSLCELQNGRLNLAIDGDLFKVTVWLPSHCGPTESKPPEELVTQEE